MKNLFLFLLLLPIISFSQTSFPYFDNVSNEDLNMTIYDKDSSAAAVYLMNYCQARYDEVNRKKRFYYDYHYQIKLFKKSAFEKADIVFHYSKKQPIENLKAVIHYMEDGQRQVTEVTDFQTVAVSKYTEALKFSFPNVKEGAVIEYQYTTIGNVIVLPKDFYFQKEYPVKHGEYHFIFPGYQDYQMLRPELKFDEFDYRKIKSKNPLKASISLTEYWWKAFDIPGLPSEPFVNNVLDYRHRIRLQITEFGESKGEGADKYKYEWIRLAIDFENILNRLFENYRPTSAIRKMVKPLKKQITRETSDLDKMKILYDYVQNNVEWNEQYTRFLTQTVEDTYKRKEGTSADINLLLYRLLKHYGMEVYPIMVSSRKNGRIRKEYPFVEQFDHVLLKVKVYDKMMIIDATDKSYPYDLLPEAILGEEGFLVNKDQSTFIGLNIKKAERQKSAEVSLKATGEISGKMHVMHKNYAAHNVREQYAEEGIEKYKTTYFNTTNDFKIISLETENLNDKTTNLIENLEFEINDVTQLSENLIYCNSLLGLEIIEHPFEADKRQLPIEMPYPSMKRTLIKIKIPEGYQVETLPENVNLNLPQDGGQYTFALTHKDGVIAITSIIYIKKLKFKVDDYEAIQAFYDKIIEVQESQIVLRKE